jgi:hypothetical protein
MVWQVDAAAAQPMVEGAAKGEAASWIPPPSSA